jgi:argininosuccinate lyase
VAKCIAEGKVLETLTLEEYLAYSELFADDLYEEISLETCVAKRISEGGTSPESTDAQISFIEEKLNHA